MTEPGTVSVILEAGVERREAQRPTSLAARTPQAAILGNGNIAVGALGGPRGPPGRPLLYEGGDPPWRHRKSGLPDLRT